MDFKRFDYGASKPQPPTGRGVCEEEPRPAACGAARPTLAAKTTRNRLCQLGTLKLGISRGAIARPYASCDLDGLNPKGTQGPGLWTLSEPDMRLLVVRIPRAVSWHSKKTWNRAVCERYSAELTRTCLPTLVGPQWAVTVVALSHSLSIVFVRKYRFCVCHFDPFSGGFLTFSKQGLGSEAS